MLGFFGDKNNFSCKDRIDEFLNEIIYLTGVEAEKERIMYYIMGDRAMKHPGLFSPACQLAITLSGSIILWVTIGGSEIIDGIIAGPYMASIEDVIEKAEKHGCNKIVKKLNEIRQYWDDYEMKLRILPDSTSIEQEETGIEDRNRNCRRVLTDCLGDCDDECKEAGLDVECWYAFRDCLGNLDNYLKRGEHGMGE